MLINDGAGSATRHLRHAPTRPPPSVNSPQDLRLPQCMWDAVQKAVHVRSLLGKVQPNVHEPSLQLQQTMLTKRASRVMKPLQ